MTTTPSSASSAPRPFRLGFLTHVHGTGDARRVYADLETLFVAAEELGFDGGFIAQHHFRAEYGRLPSPLVLLASVAQRTRHIELGTGIVTLPLEDPLRLAEDAAVLDALAGGRVQLGLGSGGANLDAFAAFGVPAESRQARFETALERLQHALSGAPLGSTAEGAPPLTLQPPAPGLRARLWHSHSTAPGARLAAHHGNGLLLGTAVHDPRTVQLPLANAYLDAWHSRAAANTNTSTRTSTDAPRIGVVRAVFPAADRRTALAELAPDVVRHIPWLAATGHTGVTEPEQILRLLNVHHGHPEEVIASLRDDPALFPFASYFLPVVQSESSTLDDTLRRLRTIAETIAPALGWRPARHAQ